MTKFVHHDPHKVPKGLSGGAIAGIVIGCLLVVVIIAAVIFFVLRKRRESTGYKEENRISEQSLVSDASLGEDGKMIN